MQCLARIIIIITTTCMRYFSISFALFIIIIIDQSINFDKKALSLHLDALPNVPQQPTLVSRNDRI